MISTGLFSSITSLQLRARRSLGLLLSGGLVLILYTYTAQSVYAASELMVSPTRIVFEGRTRTERVTLVNTGDTAGRYRISFVRRQMTETGELAEVKDDVPGMYSDTMIRFSPREVTLPPGQPQVVRLMLRKSGELTNGEYRSHMLFQALPDPTATSIQALSDKNSDKLQVQLIPIVGVTIPVIVRHGKLEASVSLKKLQFQAAADPKRQPRLTLTLSREGNRSVYGDFKVTFIPDKGETVVVARSNGFALYTPNTNRTVTLSLQAPPGVQLKNGELHVTYLQHGQEAAKGLIAEDRLRLP